MNIMEWIRRRAGHSDEDEAKRDRIRKKHRRLEDDQVDRLLEAAKAVTRTFDNDDVDVASRNHRTGHR